MNQICDKILEKREAFAVSLRKLKKSQILTLKRERFKIDGS